jgi:hypothetical protein
MFFRKALIGDPLEAIAPSQSFAPQPFFTQKNIIAKIKTLFISVGAECHSPVDDG